MRKKIKCLVAVNIHNNKFLKIVEDRGFPHSTFFEEVNHPYDATKKKFDKRKEIREPRYYFGEDFTLKDYMMVAVELEINAKVLD